MKNELNVGDKVEVRCNRIGGADEIIKVAVVKSVSARIITLDDLSKWSAKDLHVYGAQKEFGSGKFFIPRIVKL